MNQFEQARLKNEKRLERVARSNTNKPPEKKEEPKPEVSAPKVEPMTLRISGPVELTLLIDYQGTLLSSQQNEQALLALFKKCLLPIGRVR